MKGIEGKVVGGQAVGSGSGGKSGKSGRVVLSADSATRPHPTNQCVGTAWIQASGSGVLGQGWCSDAGGANRIDDLLLGGGQSKGANDQYHAAHDGEAGDQSHNRRQCHWRIHEGEHPGDDR